MYIAAWHARITNFARRNLQVDLFQKGDKVPTTLFFIGGRSEARHPLKEGLIRVLSKQLVSAESDRTNAEASLLSTRGLKKHQSHPITASIP